MNTRFLQDADRAEESVALKRRLIEEYLVKQKSEKAMPFLTTFQYWDGSHQPQRLITAKGQTIGEYIKSALIQLGLIYKQLERAPAEGFLYVKGDYIIPPVSSDQLMIVIARDISGHPAVEAGTDKEPDY